MNSPGSVTVKESALGSGNKKPRKKRHRNKFRNSNSRKKRTKKYFSKRANSLKSNISKCNIETEKIMSSWYWSNYKKAVEWQDRHKVAHWKACALALLEENRYLLQIINDMRPGMVPDVSVTQSHLGEGSSFRRKEPNQSGYFTNFQVSADGADGNSEGAGEDGSDENEGGDCGDDGDEDCDDNEDDCDNEDDIEFEMSEEMMQFFEQSYRHKMDLKKLKEKELLNKAEEEVKQMQNNKIKRMTEMNLLYGDGASMIIGMETAVQLSFDKYCDTKSPKYWPNIPFRL